MKKLISANIVNQCFKDGLKNIYVEDKNTIVTAEAKDLAKKYNIKITSHCHSTSAAEPEKEVSSKKLVPIIVDKVLCQLNDSNLDKEAITKVVQNYIDKNNALSCTTDECFNYEKDAKGLKVIRGNSVKLKRFEDAGKNKNVQLLDIITHQDGSPMSAGIMSWKKEDSFPWKITYDEVDYVIEGELQVTVDGKTYSGKAGDIFYIPKGSEIIFGTPNFTKVMYVTYPANWSK